jgi:tripartite-type tricarboxylate transporter receptor subunit TctC
MPRCARYLTALLIAAIGASSACAEGAWPTKPIRIVVGTSAGGSPDTLARIITPVLTEQLGQPVIVESRAGSGGVASLDYVTSAAPDGYTWLLGTPAHLIVAPLLMGPARVKASEKFVPVSLVATATNILVVGTSVKARSVSELIALAKANPGNLNYGSPGVGSPAHLGGAMFASMAGVSLTHVPYKGASTALTDIASGQIDLMLTSPLPAKPYLESGKMRLLASTGAKREQATPGLPTVAETIPGFDLTQWWGMFVRTGTPQPVVDKIHAALLKALKDSRVQRAFANQGVNAQSSSSMVTFAAFMASERTRTKALLERAQIKSEN